MGRTNEVGENKVKKGGRYICKKKEGENKEEEGRIR